MGLLAPLALLAIAAIIVPLAIHIARRSEIQTIDFAALRWLRQRPKPRSRLRFDEWPLLLVRIALIALIALLLARPVWTMAERPVAYVAVVPGADLRALPPRVEAHWVAPLFPPIDQPQPVEPLPIASLIRQLDAQLPIGTPLTLIVPRRLAGADGGLIQLSHKVEWRIVDGAPRPEMPTKARPMALTIRTNEAHRGSLRYLTGAATAWQVNADAGNVDSHLPDSSRILIWMDGGTIPDRLARWVSEGGTALLASDMIKVDGPYAPSWVDKDGAPLIEEAKYGKGRLLRFTRPLTAATMPELLEADFPDHLMARLRGAPSLPTQVMATDYAPTTGGRSGEAAPKNAAPWIALIIAALFLLERWMATRRTRSIAP